MAAVADSPYRLDLHPLHAVLLAGALPLFVGTGLSDLAYQRTYEPQWHAFSEWLLAGGLVLTGFALGCAVVGLIRTGGRRRVLYFLVLLATFVLGFVDSLVHARDAWASMPTGLTLSIVVAVLAAFATWLGFARRGGVS
jgi:uncharacterized membrane protein